MTSLDLYCERCSPDFWAEPVNALTNISFLVAAFFGRRLAVCICLTVPCLQRGI